MEEGLGRVGGDKKARVQGVLMRPKARPRIYTGRSRMSLAAPFAIRSKTALTPPLRLHLRWVGFSAGPIAGSSRVKLTI
jgi:hypothetical protein